MKLNNNKSTYNNTISVAFTAVIIIIVLVINMLLGIAEKNFSLTLDMTSSDLFVLSEDTKTFLSELDDDFTISILSDEVTYSQGVRTGIVNEILMRYRNMSDGHIKLQYVDTYMNPNILTEYKDETIEENGLIIEGTRGHKIVLMSDLFGTETYTMRSDQVVDCRGEQVLTSALLKLSAETQPEIYLVEGHGEMYYEGMVQLIESGSYQLDRLQLSATDIPDTADLVLISAPQADFSVDELNRLDDYLSKFGNMILLYGSECPDLPNLNQYIAEWGVRFEKNIIIDPSRYVGNEVQVAPLFCDEKINEDCQAFVDRFVLTPGARELSVLWEVSGKREVSPVLVTSDQSYAKSYENEGGIITSIQKELYDKSGSMNVGVLVENYDTVDQKLRVGSALFFSSPTMLSDSMLKTSNLLNSRYFMGMLSYMTGGEGDFVLIPSKSMRDSTLNVVNISNGVLFGAIVILPSLLVLLFGIWNFLNRRKL